MMRMALYVLEIVLVSGDCLIVVVLEFVIHSVKVREHYRQRLQKTQTVVSECSTTYEEPPVISDSEGYSWCLLVHPVSYIFQNV